MIDSMLVLRVVAGCVAAAYAAFAIRQRMPAIAVPVAPKKSGVDDMRLVLDLAARLRDEGRGDAVKLCQQLIDEMLKPVVEPKP